MVKKQGSPAQECIVHLPLLRKNASQGYDYEEAVDGRQGVNAFERGVHFECVASVSLSGITTFNVGSYPASFS